MRESENGMTLEWAQVTDLPAVLTLLEACALPTEGGDAAHSTLLVAVLATLDIRSKNEGH